MAAPVFVAAGLRHRKRAPPTAPARWRRCVGGCSSEHRCPECRCRRPRPARNAAARAAADGRACGGRTSRSRCALTAAPITAPLAPLMPLGRSTATTGTPLALIASIIARAAPSTGRSSPAPNSASTITSAPASAAGVGRLDRPRPAARRLRGIALEPAAIAQQQQPHRIAALGQDARADEAVAAVVARPGHDADRGAPRGWRAPPRRRPRGRRSPSARCPACPPRSSGGRPRPFRRWSAARSWRQPTVSAAASRGQRDGSLTTRCAACLILMQQVFAGAADAGVPQSSANRSKTEEIGISAVPALARTLLSESAALPVDVAGRPGRRETR